MVRHPVPGRRGRAVVRAAAGVAFAFVVAACTASPVGLPDDSGSPPRLPYDLAPTPRAPFEAPSPPAESPVGAIHAAPDLEALLPSSVDGLDLGRSSGTGADVFRDDPWSRRMTAFLAGAGLSPADLRFAQAWDPSQKLAFELEVFRVPGVDPPRLAAAVVDAIRAGSPGIDVRTSTLAGRPVTTVAYPDDPSIVYLYEHGDAVFLVASADRSLATALVGSLP